MKRLWRSVRDERPSLLACLVLIGIGTAGTGALTASVPGPARWLGVGVLVMGVTYVVVFSVLWVIAIRQRRQRRDARSEPGHERSPAE